jgi:histidine phosphotransfer protein HptB
MSSSTVDLAVYQELKQNTGSDFMDELIDTFLEDGPMQINEMRKALVSGDADVCRRAAHSLKSNSATFGARDLAEKAKELELLAKENRLTDVNVRLTALEEAYAEAARTLKSLKS